MTTATVPCTTTRCPRGALLLGGRNCERIERLLLLRCRLHKLHSAGVITFTEFERRHYRFARASMAAEAWAVQPRFRSDADRMRNGG